jgi:hypothetical protein
MGTAESVTNAQKRAALERKDVRAYVQMVTVKGRVHLTNHPSLGRVPGTNGMAIVFRRVGCGNHAVGVVPDAEGRYDIALSPGRYKVIFPFLNEDRTGFVDVLAAGQPRYLNVVKMRSYGGIEFNVEYSAPPD